MACFIVIHADNKDEKLQIIGNFDDNLKYTVTPDLKDYVAKLYKVRIVENEENGGLVDMVTGGDSTQRTGMESVGVDTNLVRRVIKSDPTIEAEASSTNNIIPPTIDTNTTPWCTQLTTAIDTIGQNESYGTNIPYRSRMIVPKIEVIDMTMDTSMEEDITNDTGALSIDDALIPSSSNQQSMRNDMDETVSVDTSQTLDISSRRKSGRIAKRPRCTTYDEDGEDTMDSIVDPPSQKQSKKEKEGVECMICLKQLNPEFKHWSKARQHAIRHTDLIRYECPVEECNYKSGRYDNMNYHLKCKHAGLPLIARKIELTTEQKEELDSMTRKCFPLRERPAKKQKTCTVCSASKDRTRVERHSISHIDFMLYKCNQPNCHYQSKYYGEMTKHGRNTHGIERMSKEETEIELTDEQKEEIREMIEKCFPEEEE